MRGLLRRLGTRTGISLGLIVVVVAVLAVARLGGGTRTPPPYSGTERALPSIDTTAGDDAQVAPSPSSFSDNDAVRSAASTFMNAWLQRSATPEAWHTALASLSTRALSDNLAGVDPVGVPATRVVDNPTVVLRSDLYAQVNVSVDTGRVVLGLLKQDDRWLVDTVDWERT
jgi:hypothetical protein